MATFTSRLALRLPDPTDLVSVTSDINASMSNLDAAIGFQTVTALPSSPYSGKPVMVSTDSYRSYFNNGTVPASGGWVEILNSSGTFGSDLKLASGAKLIIGVDTNLFRNAANVLRTNDALTVDGALTASSTLAVTGATTLTGGISGNLTVGGDLKLVNGATTYRNQLSGTPVVVANTAAEQVVATLTVPANDAVVGAIYKIVAWGPISVTGTPTITFRGRVGGVAGSTFGTITKTASSGQTNKAWRCELHVVVLATGGSGSWFGNLYLAEAITTTTVGANTSIDGSVAQTASTTSSQALVITAQWGTASSSNTLTAQGVMAERVA